MQAESKHNEHEERRVRMLIMNAECVRTVLRRETRETNQGSKCGGCGNVMSTAGKKR